MTKFNNFFLQGIIVLSLVAMTSCASKKEVVYLQDINNFETHIRKNDFTPKFKVNDIVSINVSTLDMEASAPFNLIGGSSEGGLRPEQLDYLIDRNGEIDFPVIGNLKISGLSSDELRTLLQEKLSDYLKDPIINIRLKNFTISVTGAVARPGNYLVNGERITIFQALGLAGDLNIKGKRDNVLVVRDFDGTTVSTRIDLTSKKVLDSPVYYLTQNDWVYVEPNKSAITSSSLDSRATIAVSIASILITSTVILISRN